MIERDRETLDQGLRKCETFMKIQEHRTIPGGDRGKGLLGTCPIHPLTTDLGGTPWVNWAHSVRSFSRM